VGLVIDRDYLEIAFPLAERISKSGRRVSPMQLAAQLLEEAVT